MTDLSFPHSDLEKWFLAQKRDLPWRETRDPYSVWVSEVMLQQTQVKTVLPYFERWMRAFPTLESLASASQPEVIKHWEGLGYYSRARNLHRGAQEIVEKYQGVFPKEEKELLSIKGIGPYTMGAIRSFAHRLRSILIDGNVKRVLSRFYAVEKDFSIRKNHQELESLAESILPSERPWNFNEGLMELGALICTPKQPLCALCPIRKGCEAYKRGITDRLPLQIKRQKTVYLHRIVLALLHKDEVLIGQKKEGVMQDLYEFPYIQTEKRERTHIEREIENFLGFRAKAHVHKTLTHTFTHHRVTLSPIEIVLDKKIEVEGHSWKRTDEAKKKPFSSGHRKVLALLDL